MSDHGSVMGLIAWRSVARHKARSAFLALCVVLGVSFVAGSFVLTDTLKNVYTKLFADSNKGTDLVVRTSSDLGSMTVRPPLSADVVSTVTAVPGVRVAEGAVFALGGRIFSAKGDPIGNQFAPTFLANWPAVPEFRSFNLSSGRAPLAASEVAIDLQAATQGKFVLGDSIRVQTLTGVKSFELVGIAKYGSAGNMGGASAVLFDLATAQQETGRVGKFDSIAVAAATGTEVGTLQDRVQAATGAKYEAITGTDLSAESSKSINDGFAFFGTFLLVFAAVSLFVGAFIVYNTFAIVVSQRTREMALLRALGADGEQVVGSILIESIIIGLIASVSGLFGGILLAIGLQKLLRALGFGMPAGNVVILPRTIIVSILGGLLVTVISAIAPALRAARVPPLAAVRSVAISTSRQRRLRLVVGTALLVLGLIATVTGAQRISIPWLGIGALSVVLSIAMVSPSIVRPFVRVLATPIRLFRGVVGQLAEENAERGARRTATTAAALMIGTSLIAASLVLASSINTSTNKLLDQGMRAELIVRADGISVIGKDVAVALRAVPGVVSVAPYRYGAFKLNGVTKQLSAMDGASIDPDNPSASLNLDVASGSLLAISDGGIAVSDRIAKDNHWKLGDILPMLFASGPHPLTIVSTFKSPTYGDYMISLATHEALFADSSDTLDFVKLVPGTTVATAKASIATLLKTAAPAAKVMDRQEYSAQVRAQVSQLLNLITALVLLAIVIALLGVLITMLLSVLERTHEIGLLRAVGMDRRDVRSMVRWEAAIIGTFGAVLGVVLGVGLGYALTKTLRNQGISTIEVPFKSLIIMSLLVTFAGVAASIYPARRASKLNVLQAIANE